MLYYRVLSARSTPCLSFEQMSYHDIACHGICEVLRLICALIVRVGRLLLLVRLGCFIVISIHWMRCKLALDRAYHTPSVLLDC